ncbi:MAG: PIN domain-containing protein [bacterium]
MFYLIVRIACIGIGIGTFYFFADFFNRAFAPAQSLMLVNRAGFMIAGALLGILITPYTHNYLLILHKQTLRTLRKSTPQVLATGFLGLTVGLIFANLVALPIHLFLPAYKIFGFLLAFSGCVIFGYLGVLIFGNLTIFGSSAGGEIFKDRLSAHPKVLDSSVLIDGRILELCQDGFVEGKLHIPSIVLEEIQLMADNADEIRRKKGRRGLDVVKNLREDEKMQVEIVDVEMEGAKGNSTDMKIMDYARIIGGVLVTNDFNLARVTEVRDIPVWNLNTLATSLRITLLPGEKIEVNVVKYGKEVGQGIAYLDDGTMIVVESGDAFIGETVVVEIKSMLQTVAGRLIFARIADEEREKTGK